MLSRRAFLTLASAALARCASRIEDVGPAEGEGWASGRVGARPGAAAAAGAAPLIVMLHGAGGRGEGARRILQAHADREGILLLAPDSIGRSWDVILSDAGPDVENIDGMLTDFFANNAVDPARVAVAGFSDGATYALTLGIANGDLFTHTIAFSPGFLALTAQVGRSPVYISHGREDEVLPIVKCSRTIVPRLERAGYHVRYREFNGGHRVPPEIAAEAVEWFLHGARA